MSAAGKEELANWLTRSAHPSPARFHFDPAHGTVVILEGEVAPMDKHGGPIVAGDEVATYYIDRLLLADQRLVYMTKFDEGSVSITVAPTTGKAGPGRTAAMIPERMDPLMDTGPAMRLPSSALEEIFAKKAAEWRRDTRALSSPTQSATHQSYQEIIGLGAQALPLILRDLATTHDHWFWALRAITREDPTRLGDNVEQATRAWLEWGREKGYLK